MQISWSAGKKQQEDTMKQTVIIKFLLCVIVCMISCSILSCIPAVVPPPFKPEDITPPAVVAWAMSSETTLTIQFNESVTIQDQAIMIQQEVQTSQNKSGTVIICTDTVLENNGTTLNIQLPSSLEAGRQYSVSGSVQDSYGNSILFVLPFWGFNPHVPKLLISELVTQGSSTHPDAIELFAVSGGNLAGITVFIGSPSLYSYNYSFPACYIAQGEYIVLHLKPQGIPEEIDETNSITASGGLDASATGRDFWSKDTSGALPGTNGAVTICSNPLGYCIDAVIYSDRTSASDTNYKGFGTSNLLAQVQEIVNGSWWSMPDGIKPEGAACSAGTTSTRTLCRWSNQPDTNTNIDWHVVPTKGLTLGGPNKDETYVPSSTVKKR